MKTLATFFKTKLKVIILAALASASAATAFADAVSDVVVGYSATWRLGMGGTDQANAALYGHWGGANNIAAPNEHRRHERIGARSDQ